MPYWIGHPLQTFRPQPVWAAGMANPLGMWTIQPSHWMATGITWSMPTHTQPTIRDVGSRPTHTGVSPETLRSLNMPNMNSGSIARRGPLSSTGYSIPATCIVMGRLRAQKRSGANRRQRPVLHRRHRLNRQLPRLLRLNPRHLQTLSNGGNYARAIVCSMMRRLTPATWEPITQMRLLRHPPSSSSPRHSRKLHVLRGNGMFGS